MKAAALTDRGRHRKLNEDTVYHQTGQTDWGETFGLYLVCDGLGGHQAGEIASYLAVETVVPQLTSLLSSLEMSYGGDHTCSMIYQGIRAAITKANQTIRCYARTHPQEANNLGTTITLALIYKSTAYIANIGDSRAYLWRCGQLTQITRDHSLAAELANLGVIEEHEIIDHPQRNMLLQALGPDEQVSAELFEWELQPGDKLLLCTDGLWQAFPEAAELAKFLASAVPPVDICRQLVDEANRRDGSDNISAVVVNVDEPPKWQLKIPRSIAAVFL
jgi:protein phosphatase